MNAQQARRILDRLVGYKASPILWKSIKTGLSAGRVQTVALRLIVEREREIRAFTPQEYWTIEALCAKDGQTFEASLAKVGRPQAAAPLRAETRRRWWTRCEQLPFVVTKVEKRNRRKNPGAPFTTSTLQQEAAKKLGFCSRRTMRAAQDLYEGMDVGEEGPVGLITYMRTDSVRVSDTAIAAVRDFIERNYAEAVPARRAEHATAPRRTPGRRTPTRRSGPPTCAAGPSTSSATSSPTSSGSTS